MKVLIIGGTGLISTAITKELVERGDEVTLYNRGHTSAKIPLTTTIIKGDRHDSSRFETQIMDAGLFDCVIDMVCFRPEEAESTIRACKGRTGQVIFCSTVDVYAKPADNYPLIESAPRVGNNDYGRDKIICEDLFTHAHLRHDFASTIIRPAMSYGEGRGIVDWSGWSTNIFDRLMKAKPIVVHGDGSAIWVACHVEDVAHAFVNAVGNERTFGKAYHVTGEEWLTWNRYYEIAAQAIGAPPPELVHIPTDLLHKVTPERAMVVVTNLQGNNIFDNASAHEDLDFRYTIPWLQGVKRVFDSYHAQSRTTDNTEHDALDDAIISAWRLAEAEMLAAFRRMTN